MEMVRQLRTLSPSPAPIRRVYIPKASNPNERRSLGIPIMRDRAEQALVKLALEPEWEARFEPNSYGFRPEICPPEAGTPQGGIASPLLANIALHGLETAITTALPKRHRLAVIRFADDFVILCEDLATLQAACGLTEKWLAEMGLTLKPGKTYITHTLN